MRKHVSHNLKTQYKPMPSGALPTSMWLNITSEERKTASVQND